MCAQSSTHSDQANNAWPLSSALARKMKNATLKKVIYSLSLIALGAVSGGYIAHKAGEQLFASVWLSALATDTKIDTQTLKSLSENDINKIKDILCFKITGWQSIYNETKYNIENGIIPLNILKSISFISEELVDLEINNKKIMSAQKYCDVK